MGALSCPTHFCAVLSRLFGSYRPNWTGPPNRVATIPAFELKIDPAKAGATGAVPPGLQCVLCDVWVVPMCELGMSEKQIHCRSHLRHLLHTGDTVWG